MSPNLPVASRHFKILTPTSVGNFPRSHDVFEFCLRRCRISENADADVYKYIFFQNGQNRVIFLKNRATFEKFESGRTQKYDNHIR